MPAFTSRYVILILFKDNTTKKTLSQSRQCFFVCDIHPINNRVTSGDPQAP